MEVPNRRTNDSKALSQKEIGPFSGIFAAIWYDFGTVQGCSAGCSPFNFLRLTWRIQIAFPLGFELGGCAATGARSQKELTAHEVVTDMDVVRGVP